MEQLTRSEICAEIWPVSDSALVFWDLHKIGAFQDLGCSAGAGVTSPGRFPHRSP